MKLDVRIAANVFNDMVTAQKLIAIEDLLKRPMLTSEEAKDSAVSTSRDSDNCSIFQFMYFGDYFFHCMDSNMLRQPKP